MRVIKVNEKKCGTIREFKHFLFVPMIVGVMFFCSGCAGLITQAMGLEYNKPAAIGRKEPFPLPLVCATLFTDGTLVSGGLESIGIQDQETKNVTLVPLTAISWAGGVPIKVSVDGSSKKQKLQEQLMVLHLSPGEYCLTSVGLQIGEVLGASTDKKICFVVKDAQVTYVGRVTTTVTIVKELMLSKKYTWNIETSDTAAEDQAFAKEQFPWLKDMPSEVSLFYTKPLPIETKSAGK